MEALKLDQLRAARGFTQAQISQTLGITQAAVSKLEFRNDAYISSLRKFINAIGGRLELSAVFPDAPVRILGLDGDDMVDLARKKVNTVCRLSPLNPAQGNFRNWFRVHSLSADEHTVNFEKDNGDLVEVPIRRIREYLPATDPKLATFVLDGRVQWHEDIQRWRFAE
jgi:transcriptional regulator with XRE-family HTH domain